jgi:hypothetical protein
VRVGRFAVGLQKLLALGGPKINTAVHGLAPEHLGLKDSKSFGPSHPFFKLSSWSLTFEIRRSYLVEILDLVILLERSEG